MQRYYLMFNLEIGQNKMEIGKSGLTIQEEEAERNMEQKSLLIWDQVSVEMGSGNARQNQQEEGWKEMILRNEWQSELEQQFEKFEGNISELNESMSELENVLFSDKSSHQPRNEDKQEAVNGIEIAQIKPREAKGEADEDTNIEEGAIDNQEELGQKIQK
ncbi:hypothetical protein OXYTRIMIC_472 [Oxytricha trifallax]|uniref:Uncharacterized protein n=1 Tax=Oxytricha trifallax TaxID=1172189 RepID=A0A073HZR3_9SPIT|nr:hypothetical protein OXYTRIMIC_472 [Oxytricha trifallax]